MGEDGAVSVATIKISCETRSVTSLNGISKEKKRYTVWIDFPDSSTVGFSGDSIEELLRASTSEIIKKEKSEMII